MVSVQAILFYLIRAVGGFSLARHLTRKRLRILCYHGFAIGDEFRVLPFMFMRRETFERRMEILKRLSIPVISLDAAVKRLQDGSIKNAETVITMDDGWASNLTVGLPILEKHGYPVCIYVTTEHLSAGPEAFNVALYYMIRKSSRTTLTLAGIHPSVDGTYNLHDPESAVTQLISTTEAAFSLAERQQLLGPMGLALGIGADEVFRDGRFLFLTGSQIQDLAQRGVDIELHTHSHRLSPDNFEAVASEISRNRTVLRTLITRDAHHFCYPSGVHAPVHPDWLQKLDITSATTCDPGLNTPHTSPMLLKRFLDSDEITDLFFEAEICGVRDLMRGAKARVRRILHS